MRGCAGGGPGHSSSRAACRSRPTVSFTHRERSAVLTAHAGQHDSGRAEVTACHDVSNGRYVLYAKGVFDATTSGALDQALSRACHAGNPRIVIDCSAVTFADVAFLRALLSCNSHGARVAVAAPSLAVRRLLEATDTSGRFLAAPDAHSASGRGSGEAIMRAGR
ncbi:STAS domain-containing protein [Streptomyces sp. NPDC006516]|uniref:STAS domain-containing protein n=1 Tax=Streptomyces sp. NPDC006516 TaxID=3154309 RepID=UPI0033B9C140